MFGIIKEFWASLGMEISSFCFKENLTSAGIKLILSVPNVFIESILLVIMESLVLVRIDKLKGMQDDADLCAEWADLPTNL